MKRLGGQNKNDRQIQQAAFTRLINRSSQTNKQTNKQAIEQSSKQSSKKTIKYPTI
ncbi:hypothetical protein TRIATDRAFT_302045 [Trichoderma atroviride IMI 206040]|uniref:Uncharacterized protein n=1 Tax=Hypocrea atroviridis (strain ATCC 20476 / IMI 206040) TaxID=452589 RepID=G9P736_HYPAI|nr:uncharacterized protein TRIATDRAFT_302045 [Trichoderma atroviride IMI 206040]EHK41538.1 hypothetical protein TRIATDRAFT_302045 [Trichoderma atroviride IMI 206040]